MAVWLAAAAVLVLAGGGVVLLPRWRDRRRSTSTAWSSARAAVARAQISRDASRTDVEEAEHLLAKAERLLADGGGTGAAETAERAARRADQLWRDA
ncbi:DUF6403 family protein [Amycolatopsis thermoflava]|uniref:DUF6403 family protein n=1 Tax=Amycolatopsis thermoflava TaxID=84480 RepID=UPI00041E109F|nr:DUF6403 family protein [Amycolatopsis thermoflava]